MTLQDYIHWPVAMHLDVAAAAIAVVALLYARKADKNREQLNIETMRVRIYNLVKDVDTISEIKPARHNLLLMKREFIAAAQAEIEPQRRLLSRGEGGRASKGQRA
jgi:hypothetical protein